MTGRGEDTGRLGGWRAVAARLTSLRLRLVAVFAAVALTAAVSASGIAYWLNRDAVLTRAQNAALNDFRQAMEREAGSLPLRPECDQLEETARRMARSPHNYRVLLLAVNPEGEPCAKSSDGEFSMSAVPGALTAAVEKRREVNAANRFEYHLYWQRTTPGGDPYLVGGAKVMGGGPTGYMLKSLDAEADDLNSLAWSLGIATLLALIGSALLAQAAATTVLRPVQRLGDAARRLGEGQLDTRLRVSGTDELADLSRTFNRTAESLEARVEELSAREAASRRFVADMSHELRTPLTAITAVTEVLEEETDSLDPMIAPAVQLVVTETRRLNDLVENLMEVTRFDAGTARLVLDDVDVADMVTACIDVRAWLDAVEVDAPRGIVARLDPRRLDVILANLIGNALKHGGSPVRVAVRTEDARTGGACAGGTEPAGAPTGPAGPGEAWDDGAGDAGDEGPAAAAEGCDLVVEVADRGPGIPEDGLPHVFDRFYKANSSRPRSEGSGLGLSIAMENALAHGGTIVAANAPDGGAVFTLRLPLGGPRPDEGHGPGHGPGTDRKAGTGRKAGEEDGRN
ncbi:sensor histidine kinase [Streptomyces sp. NPDC059506]|uniref:sensor histidine kinase n=1 Tax=Streptomyces sp. NPDC059506 TaxID=3347751 RepID=UPI0036A12D97